MSLANDRSYQRPNRNHYTNRQQASRSDKSLFEATSESGFESSSAAPISLAGSSRKEGKSEETMLGKSASQMQREHLALQQQHQQRQRQMHQQRQQQQQQQQQLVASKASKLAAAAAADQLTSSSSSDPSTVDELHHFAASSANGHHHNHQAHHHHHTISHNRPHQHQHQPAAAAAHLALSASARAAAAAAKMKAVQHSAAAAAAANAAAADANCGGRFLLGVLFTLAELLLFVSVFLWLYWAYQHDDGLAWQNDRKQQFNLHAALMLFGFVFLSGQAMLIHRSFQCCNRIYTKIMHTILFVLATSAISLGIILAYTAQENVGANNKPIMHFYSLHAWCGLATVGLFALQFSVGFISFLVLLCCDRATSSFRTALLPIHRTFGLVIFNLALATCLMGLLQTARSRLSSKLQKIDYHELAEPGLVINAIGVCLILLAILMPYIIRNLDIKPSARGQAGGSGASSEPTLSSSSSSSFRSQFDRHLNKLAQYENLRI